MDQADEELKQTIMTIWPLEAKNIVSLLVPPGGQLNNGKLTVGKIYAGLLILESWRSTRFGQIEPTGIPVRTIIETAIRCVLISTKYQKYMEIDYYCGQMSYYS